MRLTAVLLLSASILVGRSVLAAELFEARSAMVVSVCPHASQVGLDVLKQGGTAVDAAVAVALALAVTHPEAGNIGGGGFMLVLPGPGSEPVSIDYRELAPADATVDMLAAEPGQLGHKFVGVPGTIAGLALAYERFGKLAWSDLVRPAGRLAGDGFAVDERLAGSLNELVRTSGRFEELIRVFSSPRADGWKAGDRLVQRDLAASLTEIMNDGPQTFYRGRIAEQIVAEMRAGGGLIAADDLAAYKAIVRKSVHGTYRGFDIYAPGPPSSGGVALVEMLNILESFDLQKLGRESTDAVHLTIESMRRAYLDRARHLGDSDFVEVPAHLTDKKYARELAAGIDRQKATRSEDLAADIPLAGEGADTTHFSIIDSHGMAVANTYTLEQSYGSRVVVRGTGFLLNNEMGDFNRRPGYTDRSGRIGTKANLIAPRKRMLSSMTPTIVARDGRAVLITGSPGGRTIINTVLGIVLNVVEFDMDLKAAVEAPRFHHQWLPDRVSFEGASRPEYAGLMADLRARGHTISTTGARQGDAHSISVRDGRILGVADHRIRGHAAGY